MEGGDEGKWSAYHLLYRCLSQDWDENYRREGKHSSPCAFLTREGTGVITRDTQRCDQGKTYVPIPPYNSRAYDPLKI